MSIVVLSSLFKKSSLKTGSVIVYNSLVYFLVKEGHYKRPLIRSNAAKVKMVISISSLTYSVRSGEF